MGKDQLAQSPIQPGKSDPGGLKSCRFSLEHSWVFKSRMVWLLESADVQKTKGGAASAGVWCNILDVL